MNRLKIALSSTFPAPLPVRIPGAALLIIAIAYQPAHAASTVLDQSVIPTNPPCCAFGVNSSFPLDSAQTFTVGLTGLLSRVDVFVQLESGPGPFHWDVRPVSITGAPVDSNAAALAGGDFSIPIGGYSFVTLNVPNVPVSAGQRLAVALSTPNGSFGWGLSDAGYAGGDAWQRSGTFNNGFAWITNLQPGNDLGFRTFVTVPEPATIMLLCLGACLLITRLRPRSARSLMKQVAPPRVRGTARAQISHVLLDSIAGRRQYSLQFGHFFVACR